MTIEQIYGNPYAYARATMDRSMTDREQSIWIDSCVANWDDIKKEEKAI